MHNAFVERLRGHAPLSDEDTAILVAACGNIRALPAGYHLIREGDKPDPVFVMLEGWAIRYKILSDGGRQVMAFMLPGDFCDIHIGELAEMDHNVVTLTKARVSSIPRLQMETLIGAKPVITRAFWWAQLVDQGVLRAWIVNMGRRKSVERVAHLMCELYLRMRNIGLVTEFQCAFPISQIVLADALGLTPVHVNRVLNKLRSKGVITLNRRVLTILNPIMLSQIAGFDNNYLHGQIRRIA